MHWAVTFEFCDFLELVTLERALQTKSDKIIQNAAIKAKQELSMTLQQLKKGNYKDQSCILPLVEKLSTLLHQLQGKMELNHANQLNNSLGAVL